MNHLKNITELSANLARLYADALELPDVPVRRQSAEDDVMRHGNPWNFSDQYFWAVMNPLDETSLCQSSLKDALADIEHDLENGIALYESGDSFAAAALWRCLFFIHWGAHFMEVVPFLHTVIKEKMEI
ncbi:MAG: DUF5063 domain-containing protein [Selenomonadaceae bacterium]